MTKLRDLLKQLGGSDELADAISEEFARYAQEIKSKYDAEFKDKITKARAVCLEEVNKEKASLARKVAIYLEAKQDHFEKAAEKQRLNEESEATNRLKRAKALLEGVEVDGSGQSRELQAARRQITRLQQAVDTLREERNLAVDKANKANTIAADVLKKNRLLEQNLKQTGQTAIAESTVKPAPRGNVTAGEPKPASRPAPRRLDEGRRVPSPGVSTRTVLKETQVKSPTNSQKRGDDPISNIASALED